MILIVAESLSFWRIYILLFLSVIFILVYRILENDVVFHLYSNSAQKWVAVLICVCFCTMCLLYFSLCLLKYVIVPCYGSTQLHEGFKFLFETFPCLFPCSCRYFKHTRFFNCSHCSSIACSSFLLFPGAKCSSPVVDIEHLSVEAHR